MERFEAFKTLRLDPSADGHMVETAYWSLVRGAQERGNQDIEAAYEIERLNEAYAALQPDGRRYHAPQRRMAGQGTGLEFIDDAADWLAEEAQRTRERWADRNPEIAMIAVASLVLMVLALGAGASLLATFIAAAVVFAGIWAPWRRPQSAPRDRERP